MVQETKEWNGKQTLNFHEQRQNIPFGQITDSYARVNLSKTVFNTENKFKKAFKWH